MFALQTKEELVIKKIINDLKFLLKNKYDKSALYDIPKWFQETIISVLKQYKENSDNYPIIVKGYLINKDDLPNTNESKKLIENNKNLWDGIINRMIYCAQRMNCDSSNAKEIRTAKNNRDEFFEMFNTYFWEFK